MKQGWAGLTTLVMMLVAGCASSSPSPAPVDIPVGVLGLPSDVEASAIASFLCANNKHFTIAYLTDQIYFSTGVGGVLPLRMTRSTSGVRYDGGNFTVVTSANRAIVYYDSRPAMWDCYSVMQ